jgi:ribosomal protein L37AE/L43A
MFSAYQLDQARAIAAQPIPQDIVEDLKKEETEPQYFEIPACPKCKAEDPTLESVEPSNNWLCESCGYTWSDPIPDPTTP